MAKKNVRHFSCPVHGSIACSPLEMRVIDTPIFQRLRRIKQLGNTAFVFPGATHTRFSHSLGVMHLAGTLFDALLPPIDDGSAKATVAARERLRVRVRLAGLLHDIGHGPYSHHFEHLLVKRRGGKTQPILYGEWDAPELRTPTAWQKREKGRSETDAFAQDELAHEHFTYGLIRIVGDFLASADFDAQGICAMLDERIAPSDSLEHDLTVLAGHMAGDEGVRARGSLQKCLKSILSSDIDADRMDYLQRDSLSCGVLIGLDLRHLFASASLEWNAALGRFVVLVRPNAVGVIEQILIARKQMFDQVYQHRVTVAFDALLTDAMHVWMRETGTRPPATLHEFLSLTDDALDEQLRRLVADTRVVGETQERLALKMFVTRTAPVREDERIVSPSDAARVMEDLRQARRPVEARGRSGGGSPGVPDIVCVSLKEFFKASRESLDSRKDVLFVGSAARGESNDTAKAREISPTPLRLFSEVLQSTAWRITRVRVTVYRPRVESAVMRGLQAKLRFFVDEEWTEPQQPLPATKKKSQAVRKAPNARVRGPKAPRSPPKRAQKA